MDNLCTSGESASRWSRYAKWKTRDKLVRELAAMDPDHREKVLSRLHPKLATEVRAQLMKRFRR